MTVEIDIEREAHHAQKQQQKNKQKEEHNRCHRRISFLQYQKALPSLPAIRCCRTGRRTGCPPKEYPDTPFSASGSGKKKRSFWETIPGNNPDVCHAVESLF
jgi:hypothetical protein